MNKWPVEEIPDGDMLYYRIHKRVLAEASSNYSVSVTKDYLPPAVFIYQGGDLSVGWEKHTTANKLLKRARSPSETGVVEFAAGPVREDGHTVVHSPSQCNRAHSSIRGNQPDVRVTLSRIARWKINIK